MSIEVMNLNKSYGKTCALNNVSVKFEDNVIYGLLGRNGAGKTTLLNIITNHIFADSGEVLVDGIPSRENDAALQRMYLMSEHNYYPERMKIKDIFKWSRDFYPSFDMDVAMGMAEKFGLNVNKMVKGLSTGYTSIFKVIVALSVNAPYILLDEPVLGLDANHRDLFYRLLLQRYSENPCTIIISTHLIEEVSGIIENVVIINEGKIIKNESRDELMSKGYTVAGKASLVDSFIIGKEVLGMDLMGGLKSAYVLGRIDKEDVPEGLETSNIDLQKLFVKLTSEV